MTIQQFFDFYEGLWVETNKGSADTNDQCVDLWRAYNLRVVGGPWVTGNAVDYWTNFPTDFYDKIPNDDLNDIPRLGDVIIWGTEYGSYGHIAVCTDIADTKGFTSFDQNDPLKSPCHFQQHTYRGVLGWLRPKKLPIDTPELAWLRQMYSARGIDLSKPEGDVRGRVQEIFDGNDKYVEAVRLKDKALADLAEARGDATKWEENYITAFRQIESLKKEIEDLNAKVSDRDGEIGELITRMEALEAQIDPDKVLIITREEYARLTAKKTLDKFTRWELFLAIFRRR